MNEIICPCCGAGSPGEGLYCMRCGEPTKCKNCGAGILASARACIQCGKLIPERESRELPLAGGALVPPGYNRLTVRQRAESFEYSADFLFSNAVGQQAGTGEFISLLAGFGDRAAASRPTPQQPGLQHKVVEVDGQQPIAAQLASASDSAASVSAGTRMVLNSKESPDERAIRSVFAEHGGRLMLQMSDLKAANQTDYALRLAHMYLYARQVLFAEQGAPRGDVYEVTDFANLNRDNVAVFLSRDNSITKGGSGDILSLNVSGVEHARKSLAEIMDPAVSAGKWTPSAEARGVPRGRKVTKRRSARISDDQMAAIVSYPATRT